MSNIIQLNPYHALTFDELIEESNKTMNNFNQEKAIALMSEFKRRLRQESESLYTQVCELKNKIEG